MTDDDAALLAFYPRLGDPPQNVFNRKHDTPRTPPGKVCKNVDSRQSEEEAFSIMELADQIKCVVI